VSWAIRKARCWRIRLTAEVDPDDVAFTRNHMAIDDAQHGNTPSLHYARGRRLVSAADTPGTMCSYKEPKKVPDTCSGA